MKIPGWEYLHLDLGIFTFPSPVLPCLPFPEQRKSFAIIVLSPNVFSFFFFFTENVLAFRFL